MTQPVPDGYLRPRPSPTNGYVIKIDGLWAHTDKSGRSNGLNLYTFVIPSMSLLRQTAKKADGSRGPRFLEFVAVALRLKQQLA